MICLPVRTHTSSLLLPDWCPSSFLIYVAFFPRQSQGAETFNDLDCDFVSEMTLAYDVNSVPRTHTFHSSLTQGCERYKHAHQLEVGQKVSYFINGSTCVRYVK